MIRAARHVSDLSRRDNRTQPGVLTPGADKKTVPPEGAPEENVIARTLNGVGNDSTAALTGRVCNMDTYLGLKPQTESFHPCGTHGP